MWTPADIPKMFFAAMRQGFAAHVESETLKEFPHSHIIRFKHENWEVKDVWHTPPHSRNSWGETIVYADDEPVWMMHYWGNYTKVAIPFLRKALAAEYIKDNPLAGHPEVFNGCRGGKIFQSPDFPLTYINIVRPGSTFAEFSGREEIVFSETNGSLGFHEYYGRSVYSFMERV